ncbi:1-acyl-sn-glycerol-3-phosphate acyltransferase [Marivirga sp. S37H4]|uniref:1-acyl-sn-glycerol-3-phosphate acyltransferase n=1 Tax=Marivirga aurantiaca TaxID=2802615 RepID=A0A935CBP1_9BACT|nr:lysophospholipid acyltransferase family protein [Marivirga aurantiaca]MBK6267431.1 1-acyl-sn-glycerol-3-phosphate acyltransferase [Marivirga aurantiaca]
MNKTFQRLYTLWCAIVFAGIFLILFPFFLVLIMFPKWHHHSFYLNRFWAWTALKLVGIPTKLQGVERIDKTKQYVYCSNHFSLLDILSFGFAPNPVVYVGKESLAKIPFFGFMFSKLHVTVNRESMKNSYQALQRAIAKMGENRSLVMYPEGGIYSKDIPRMARFKDGAFRAAIEKQIPVVPVTLPDNWIILPDERAPLIRRRKMKMIFHEPIPTKGLNMKDVPALKEQVFKTIERGINQHHPIYEYK